MVLAEFANWVIYESLDGFLDKVLIEIFFHKFLTNDFESFIISSFPLVLILCVFECLQFDYRYLLVLFFIKNRAIMLCMVHWLVK